VHAQNPWSRAVPGRQVSQPAALPDRARLSICRREDNDAAADIHVQQTFLLLNMGVFNSQRNC
jgi:hypothetical protein